MDKIEATVVEEENKHFLRIHFDPEIDIPISENDANAVKSAFNTLIEKLRSGIFEIELNESSPNLFFQIATEYITQLNSEISEVFTEMTKFGFVDSGEDSETPPASE